MEGIAWRWQSVDGAMMKAPLAQEAVGPNPTDRGKKGSKRHRQRPERAKHHRHRQGHAPSRRPQPERPQRLLTEVHAAIVKIFMISAYSVQFARWFGTSAPHRDAILRAHHQRMEAQCSQGISWWRLRHR
jgi:hypothetical protein